MTDANHTTKTCSRCLVDKPATTEFFSLKRASRDGLLAMCKVCIREETIKQIARRRESSQESLQDDLTKTCTICHEDKPATREYFEPNVLGKYGLRGACRACRGALIDGRKVVPANDPAILKTCSICQEEKPATTEFFRRRKDSKDGLRADCRVCQNIHIREWAKNNPEKVKAGILRWNAEHPEQVLQRAREWYERNPDRARERTRRWRANHYEQRISAERADRLAHPEKYREAVKRYTKTPKGRISNLVHHAIRRARKAALLEQFSQEDWLFCLNYWAYACAICGNEEGFLWKLAADHWIPLADQENCPGTVPWNMLPLCHGDGGCNNQKHSKEPVAWLLSKLGKAKGKKKLQEINTYFDLAKSR